MIMMMIRSKEILSDELSTSPTWKLYENPYYSSPLQQHKHQQEKQIEAHIHKPPDSHRITLPISSRKIASAFWDLTFIKPFMASELDVARAQIMELKANVERERKARKKLELINKRLVKELSDAKKGREEAERVCSEVYKEISLYKEEISRAKLEMQEERKMLRVSEVLREERVQMKLAEAKFMLEEKFLELEAIKRLQIDPPSRNQPEYEEDNVHQITNVTHTFYGESSSQCTAKDTLVSDYGKSDGSETVHCVQRRVSSVEAENPHIKRGIRGFVEFPKVVRAIGSKSRHFGTKLECQKSQLMVLLKQKSIIRSNNLIMS
ncbi:protein BRANCHLESS TRICHOME [Apium graveolens]|uniref:protein BRANCHLESS TRICHOME n=1 Tax=Apium graveolens TaxID=4045 RepID=UPI003D7B28D5